VRPYNGQRILLAITGGVATWAIANVIRDRVQELRCGC